MPIKNTAGTYLSLLSILHLWDFIIEGVIQFIEKIVPNWPDILAYYSLKNYKKNNIFTLNQ